MRNGGHQVENDLGEEEEEEFGEEEPHHAHKQFLRDRAHDPRDVSTISKDTNSASESISDFIQLRLTY
jgi:hypothetical protein